MKKAPKINKFANGGQIPKTKEEHDKYYQGLGYKQIPGSENAAYYDPRKYNYDPASGKWTALTSDASVTGWGGVNTGPKDIYEFTPQKQQSIINPTPAKVIPEDTGRKPVFTGNQYYDTFQVADANKQYGNATTEYIDKKTGQKIDPAKSFDASGKYAPIYYKEGGIVKKLKGYAQGGSTSYKEDNKSQQAVDAANAAAGIASQASSEDTSGTSGVPIGAIASGVDYLGGLGTAAIDQKHINPETGLYDSKGSAIASGAIKGGTKGAGLGASIGGQFGGKGALIGAGIGLGVGALAGGGTNAMKQNQGESAIEFAKRQNEYDKARTLQQNEFNTQVGKQLLARQMGYKEGGIIKGKGGPKSDDIRAKVKEGSFIVPAEKAELAKEVSKKLLKAPKKKEADLNQEDGVDVKLSNGEFMFTPEEKNEIINELGEEFLEHLAPNAEHEKEELREGGLTPAKAKMMLSDGSVNGKPLTDKQKGYFGLIASGYKCGGMVKGYEKGGHVSPEESRYKAAQKKYDDLKQEEVDLLLSKDKTALSRLRDVRSQRAAIEKEYGFNNTGKSNIPTKTGSELDKTNYKSAPKIKKETASILNTPKTPQLDTNLENVDITPSGTEKITDISTDTPVKNGMTPLQKQKVLNSGVGLAKQLGSLANYALPYRQYQMGQKFLAQTGKRPVDKIDPDFLNSVQTAQANAKFGLTPEEKSILNQQNISALRAGQNAAQNYSGGSAGNAYVLSRDAANKYYGRGLQALLANKQTQMDKQAYADQLVGNKAEMNRRLFGDTMNAWQQNQQAGGNQVGAAIQNLIGAQRYNQEQNFQRELAQNNNPWQNYNVGI